MTWAILKRWYDWSMTHSESYNVTLEDRGRMVLPTSLRRSPGLQPGDRLILTVDPEGGFHAVSAREQWRRLLGMYRDLAPGRSLADELIAERRAEACRESGE